MKGRSTLVLLASIFVLGAFIAIQETWRAKVPSREYRRVKLFDLDITTLDSIEFEYTNQVVECVKDNGIWTTGNSETGFGHADVALIHHLVAGLNTLGKGTTITQEHLEMRGLDEAEYGLNPPALRITAKDNHGDHSWLVGRTNPLGDMLYVKERDHDDIFTISASLLEIAPLKAGQLRDRVLFPVDIPGIRQLEVRGLGGFVQLLKDSKNGWQLQQPISAPANFTEVSAYLERLHGLRIEEFVADNVSDFSVYGLQGETQQISLGGVDDISRMLVLGDEIPDRPGLVYARRADDTSVFALNKEVLDMLSLDPADFRDRSVLPLAVKEISSISISHGSESLELFSDDAGQWVVRKPVSWAADLHAVMTMLQMWDHAVVVEFDDSGSDEEVEWTFEFGSAGLGQTNVIHVLPRDGRLDGIRIKRGENNALCQLNLQLIPDELGNPLSYKDRLVWNLDVDEIQKVSMIREDAAGLAIERLEDGSFAPFGTNANLVVDASALERVLDKLIQVTATSYVTYNPRDLTSYGLDVPVLSLHVGLSGTNQLGRVLLIGEETDGGHYAMVQGRDVIFLLDKSVVEDLSSNLFIAREITNLELE
jgi:hypothetical protein